MGEQIDSFFHSSQTLGSFEETARSHLNRSWSATPAQRLAWLEEALRIAHQAGALPIRTRNGEKLRQN